MGKKIINSHVLIVCFTITSVIMGMEEKTIQRWSPETFKYNLTPNCNLFYPDQKILDTALELGVQCTQNEPFMNIDIEDYPTEFTIFLKNNSGKNEVVSIEQRPLFLPYSLPFSCIQNPIQLEKKMAKKTYKITLELNPKSKEFLNNKGKELVNTFRDEPLYSIHGCDNKGQLIKAGILEYDAYGNIRHGKNGYFSSEYQCQNTSNYKVTAPLSHDIVASMELIHVYSMAKFAFMVGSVLLVLLYMRYLNVQKKIS